MLWEGLERLDYVLTALAILLFLLPRIGLGSGIVDQGLTLVGPALDTVSVVIAAWFLYRRRSHMRAWWRTLRGRALPEWEDDARYGRRNEIEQLVDVVVGVSRRTPMVIVIDDAHVADETLVTFVEEVMQRPWASVLIVACSWPMDGERELPFEGWLNRQRASMRADLELVDLSADVPMSQDDLIGLMRAEIHRQGLDPGTVDDEVYTALAKNADGNALAAVAQLQTATAMQLLQSGTLDLQEATRLPTGLREIIRSYWQGIPEPVRSALALAALIGRDFPDAPVVASLDSAGSGPGLPLIERASSHYRVLRSPQTDLRRFVDHLYLSEAQNDAQDGQMVTPSALAALGEEIRRRASAENLAEEPSLLREAILTAHVQLTRQAHLDDRAGATRSAMLLGRHYAARSGYRNALVCAQHAEELDPRTDDALTFAHRFDRTGYSLADGQSEDAQRRARELLIFANGAIGELTDAAIRARLRLVEIGIASGRHLEMFEEAERALELARALEGCPSALINRLETQVAECSSRSGDFERAATILEALAARLDADEDASSEEAVTAKFAALKIRLRSGMQPAVIPELRRLIDRSDRELGADHPQSLRGRLLLVEAMMTYQHPEALDEGRLIVTHAKEVRSSGHVDVIRARIRQCEATRAMGTTSDLLRETEQTHRLAAQSLGRANPNTVRALGVLVDALIRDAKESADGADTSRWERAEASCDDLLRLCTNTYGPTNADTLMVERRRALILGGQGRTVEGLDLIEDLLGRTKRIRGPEHPDTLRTRGIQIELRGLLTGWTSEYAASREELIADCSRIMGSGHPLCATLGQTA
jgi:tetratricopeptide (TPR) repeat protein